MGRSISSTNIIFFLLAVLLTTHVHAGKAAKAIIVKGKVYSIIKGKKEILKRGAWLPEGAQVKTAKKSFTKLIFIDKSTMNVGPNSQMKIDTFPKSKAGVITLVKGKVRSKVTKNYMEMKNKNKSKLFIKTKTAAMGVRGTDFTVSFNPKNGRSALITFEGAVAMAKLQDLEPNRGIQNALEKVLTSNAAVIVRKGQFSSTSPKAKAATIPTKLSPNQFQELERNKVPGLSRKKDKRSSKAQKPKKKFNHLIPPGVDPKKMANDGKGLEKAFESTIGKTNLETVKEQVQKEIEVVENNPPPEGIINDTTGAIAPTAGGYIDLDTAQYIPPPKDSVYDANAGVYVPPPDVGYIDPSTGDFTNDQYELNPDGSFKLREPLNDGSYQYQNTQESTASREVASLDGNTMEPTQEGEILPPPPEVTDMPTMEDTLYNEIDYSNVYQDGSGDTSLLPPPPDGFDPTTETLDDSVNSDTSQFIDSTNQTDTFDNDQTILNNNTNGNLLFDPGTTPTNFNVIIGDP